MHRGLVLVAVGFLASSCGAAGTPSTQAKVTAPPTYAQVILAMTGALSVHVNVTATAGAVADVRGNSTGAVMGTLSIGASSYQFFVQLRDQANGTLGSSTYESIPNAAFSAACHCGTPDTCTAFSPAYQAASGLSAQAINDQFTPAGIAHSIVTVASSMSVQGTSTVFGERVFVFKGSGRELDVPQGSRLPVRWVNPGVTTAYMGDWGSAGPIAKPSSCP